MPVKVGLRGESDDHAQAYAKEREADLLVIEVVFPEYNGEGLEGQVEDAKDKGVPDVHDVC